MGGEVMLYKNNTLGRKYTRIITGSPVLFISFVIFGLALFFFLTLTTKIDVMETYEAEVIHVEGETILSINDADISVGVAYIYSNKNEIVYPVLIEETESIEDTVTLYFNRDEQEIINSILDRDIFIDIPKGEETLLYRIFMKGGKSRE